MSTLHFIIDILDIITIAAFASGYTEELISRSKGFFVGSFLFIASTVLSAIDLFV